MPRTKPWLTAISGRRCSLYSPLPIEVTRLGFRHKSEPVVKAQDAHGRTIYWVGPAGGGQDTGDGTDFQAIEEGAVAVTPLKTDLTRHEALPSVAEWLRSG